MHIRLLAVGDRQPAWVSDACERYVARLPRTWKFRSDTVATVHRRKHDRSQQAMAAESDALLAKIPPTERVVLLDETGKQFSSKGLANKLDEWQSDGRNLCFVIGGPDGVSERLRQRADVIWSLALLTMPHGLVRVLLVEQLYRAWSLQTGHPYHRE